ncbi:hypothetical protein ICV32_01625 [Polynucleobacter sp. MWH-UH24A]|uniref:hypothetical protein n=1 Tax=Polynucleobacter sp. MWH-UH24A TaxID=2689110 RepID=UPI001BFD6BB0|nr:hypothetical protein [Polynucleobacter sp. MWH-UH24A]QWD76398.1 hypothetical protein ICV32_01625 [Polynucleobacter sp. MWH-UH24A]
MNQPTDKLQSPSIDNLRWVLIILSSILLGIWAVKETIALRNILLVVGTLLSLYYIALEFRYEKLKEDLSLWKLLPLILIACSFLWVIVHYFFFSVDPIAQLDELKSTWLRALLAFIVGLGAGLALRNYPNRLNLLWLGILLAFCVLYYQYIPRALAQNQLLVPDYDHYLFHLKFNAVLAGMIFVAGIDGALLDHFRAIHYQWSHLKLWYFLYWLVGTSMALWAFVFIVNARNGIGLSIILYSFWFICVLIFFIQSQMRRPNVKSLLALLFAAIILCLVVYFAFLQTNINSGWNTILKDAKIAVQIERYPHWQNPAMGLPQGEDGHIPADANYGRIAWAVAGLSKIFENWYGVGTLAYPLGKHPNPPVNMPLGENDPGIATHSGWIELGLAFGFPILALIFSVLLLSFIEATRNAYPARMTVLGLVVLIFSLYTVGEVAIQHGIEILYYLLAFISGLIFVKPTQAPINNLQP